MKWLPSTILNSISEEIACLYWNSRGLISAPSFFQYFILKSKRLMSTRKGCRNQKERRNNKPCFKCRDVLFEAWIQFSSILYCFNFQNAKKRSPVHPRYLSTFQRNYLEFRISPTSLGDMLELWLTEKQEILCNEYVTYIRRVLGIRILSL